MMVNISLNNQKANYVYLGEGSPVTRLIKLLEGEDGCGTCYNEVPGCKKNYCLRHSGDKLHRNVEIQLQHDTKLQYIYDFKADKNERKNIPPNMISQTCLAHYKHIHFTYESR